MIDFLGQIARTEFSIPNIAPAHPLARPPSPRFLAPLPSSDPFDTADHTEPATSSQGTDKENANPSSPATARDAGASTNAAPASQSSVSTPLPKPVADMLDEILSVLRSNFSRYPPHTIQRLAELVLSPRQHYRNVVPYLHALDRVVHVTSGANIYPLPPALPDIGAMSLLANGMSGGAAGSLSIDTIAANSLGSDEALGGALLTPIPWLTRRANGSGSEDGSDASSSSPLSASGNPAQQFHLQQQQQQQVHGAHLEGRVRTESTETIEGPNGMGSIETVSVSVNGIPSTGAGVALLTQHSVTQGELLRQEQRAGLVPLNQLSRQQQRQAAQGGTSGTADEDAAMSEDAAEGEDEIPHARGPEEIGPADTGPQSAATASYIAGGGGDPISMQGIDVEAAVGRRVQSPPAQQQQPPSPQQQETTARASGSPEDLVARSPKREATSHLEPESPRKRVKEAADPTSSESQDQGESSEQTATAATSVSDPAADPQRDAEGDVELPDTDAAATPEAPTTKPEQADAAAASSETEPSAQPETATVGEEAAKDGGDGDASAEQEEVPDKAAPSTGTTAAAGTTETETAASAAADAGPESEGG